MKCINCGAEINDGAELCPLCGAAQTAMRGSENMNNGQPPYEQQQWQQPQPSYENATQQWQQSPYEQQQQPYMQQQKYENTSQQWQQSPYEQQQQPYMQQQAYGNTSQQWQQPYGQQQPPYGQQFNQGLAYNPIRKKSKAPLIIGIVAAILIIAGLTVTGIILLTSSSPEKTVEKFFDAVFDGEYAEAVDCLHPAVIDTVYDGSREAAIQYLKTLNEILTSYTIVNSEDMDDIDVSKCSEIDNEITKGSWVEIRVKGDEDDSGYLRYAVVKSDGKWYIIDSDY